MSSGNGHSRRRVEQGLKKRYRRERRFQMLGLGAVLVSVAFLAFFFSTLVGNGYSAFRQTHIEVTIDTAPIVAAAEQGRAAIRSVDYQSLIRAGLVDLLGEVDDRRARREMNSLISVGARYEVRDLALSGRTFGGGLETFWLPAADDVDMIVKGHADRTGSVAQRRLSDRQLAWLEQLEDADRVALRFNKRFFTAGDSRDPELAGIWGATVGSALMLVVTLLLSFPLGVATAVYLEEFAPRNRWTDLIEVNINNLAAVPSIVFGLLGLALFINVAGLPRSAPLVGGLVLTLMTLPVIIIAARAALTSVPPSIREAALGVGASRMQVVFHHVLPLAMPGMLTGTIIGMARALGESAPLLMIGMVAFIVEVPGGPLEPASALPVQIFLWADSPERGFVEKTSAAILVLLAFLLVMNAAAILLRKRFERRW